jgi:dienelactone hydrolase
MLRWISLFLFISTVAVAFEPVRGEIVRTPIHYRQGDTNLEGLLVYDNSVTTPRPGVVIFPEWWGLTEYPKQRAEQLAQLGYVAFAADMYGDGKTTDDPAEAGKLDKAVMDDSAVLRGRAQAALDVLTKDPHVDTSKIAAIGYCFGGTVSLELARSGAPIVGVVSFHGGLSTKEPGRCQENQG